MLVGQLENILRVGLSNSLDINRPVLTLIDTYFFIVLVVPMGVEFSELSELREVKTSLDCKKDYW